MVDFAHTFWHVGIVCVEESYKRISERYRKMVASATAISFQTKQMLEEVYALRKTLLFWFLNPG